MIRQGLKDQQTRCRGACTDLRGPSVAWRFCRATVECLERLQVRSASRRTQSAPKLRASTTKLGSNDILMDLRLPGTNTLIAIRGSSPRVPPGSHHYAYELGHRRRNSTRAACGSFREGPEKPAARRTAGGHPVGSWCKRYVPADVAARLAEHLGEEELTTRELEVLKLIRDGYRNKQIADKLSISENMVNFHIKNLVDKLGANDRTHAVTIALRRGLRHRERPPHG